MLQAARNSTPGIVVTCPPNQPVSIRDTLSFLLAGICKVRRQAMP